MTENGSKIARKIRQVLGMNYYSQVMDQLVFLWKLAKGWTFPSNFGPGKMRWQGS